MAARRWSQLKTLPTPFVGRTRALRELDEALERSRMVTVLGPPGTGKTRLAKEYALSTLGRPWTSTGPETTGPSLEGGVFFCDLSDATAAEDIVPRVASAFGLEIGTSPQDGLARLVHALESSAPALVILDNFEQLVRSAAGVVAALALANGRTRFLVTSRERLGVAGEALFDLAPLELPVEGSTSGEAIELFVERARAASSSFQPTPEALADVAVLVRWLDGLPLAIELAAARIRVLSAREIVERSTERFTLLTRDTSTLGRGGATLWETIDASWVLLSDSERRALSLLSVFRGGFDVRAAERVVDAPRGAPATIDVLQSLRDKSLILGDDSDAGTRRFILLASIREFAAERAGEGELAGGERRHAAHFLELGERLGERLSAGSDPGAAKQLAIEHENVMAVHRRFLEPARARVIPDAALRAAMVVCQSASAFPYAFCLSLLDAAIAAIDSKDGNLSPRLLARAHESRGNLRRFVGRVDESTEDFECVRTIAEAVGDAPLLAVALSGLGNAATVRARWSEARDLFERALAVYVQSKDRGAEGRTLAMLAATRFNEDAPEDAREMLGRAIERTRTTHDRFYEGVCTTSLGIVAVALGALAEARVHLGDALRIHSERGVRHWEGVTLAYLAMLEHEAGRVDESHELHARAIDLLHEIDVKRAEGLARFQRATLWLEQGRAGEAKAELQRALDLARTMAPDHEGLVLGALGGIAANEGDLAAADDLFTCAELALRPFQRASFAATIEARRGLADLARARGATDAERARLTNAARERLAATEEIATRSFEVRVARRELSRALEAASAAPVDPKRTLVVGPSGIWFKAPKAKASVHLHRRHALQRLVHALASSRSETPGEAVAIAHLVATGWPGERVLPEAGTERVYTAVATLRRLGLKGLLLQRDDGYLLDPAVVLVRSTSKT